MSDSLRTTGTGETFVELDASVRHQLLSDARRRATLIVLRSCEPPIDLETLAEAVVRWEEGSKADVDRTALVLHHHHLPMLDQAGVLWYDSASNRIESLQNPFHELTEALLTSGE
ncbi:DUF7344 domain-containing protein [Halorarius litoreus]|uniref:DUF7344 domain-containing protein n=1 Tax=Halorarius litoreus TaxID=2962676 RepID=UPI0020CD77A9|nr:hypothetical protein [Halorarius litoreus]